MQNLDVIKDFRHLNLQVDSKIPQKYLQEFFKTQLSLNDIIVDSSTLLYYNFIEYNCSYEIIIIDKKGIAQCLLPIWYYSKTDIVSNDIFLFENYFVLYKNGKFFALKYIEDSSCDDIILYARQVYGISIDNCIVIDESLYNRLVDKSDIKKISYMKLSNSAFDIFVLFFIVATVLFLYIYYYMGLSNNNVKKIDNRSYDRLLLTYKQFSPYMSKNMLDFFKYLKLSHIKILKLSYDKKTIKTVLLNQNKQNFYDFLSNYTKYKIDYIVYDNSLQLYKMGIKIEF